MFSAVTPVVGESVDGWAAPQTPGSPPSLRLRQTVLLPGDPRVARRRAGPPVPRWSLVDSPDSLRSLLREAVLLGPSGPRGLRLLRSHSLPSVVRVTFVRVRVAAGPVRSPTPWRDRSTVVVGLTAVDDAPESARSTVTGLRASSPGGEWARSRSDRLTTRRRVGLRRHRRRALAVVGSRQPTATTGRGTGRPGGLGAEPCSRPSPDAVIGIRNGIHTIPPRTLR